MDMIILWALNVDMKIIYMIFVYLLSKYTVQPRAHRKISPEKGTAYFGVYWRVFNEFNTLFIGFFCRTHPIRGWEPTGVTTNPELS